jgi:hypothetical protein
MTGPIAVHVVPTFCSSRLRGRENPRDKGRPVSRQTPDGCSFRTARDELSVSNVAPRYILMMSLSVCRRTLGLWAQKNGARQSPTVRHPTVEANYAVVANRPD